MPAPPSPHALSIHNLSLWDGLAYLSIATDGYHYDQLQQSTAAFFPLLPFLMWLAHFVRIDPAIAGIVINNVSSLVAAIALYDWVLRRWGISQARWVCATLVLLPFSVFTFVLYTEGLFLAITTLALSEFERRRYWTAAIFGALSSACRAPGILISVTFLCLSVRERRGWAGFASAAFATLGLIGFILFSAHTMHEPLAFIKAQSAWAHYGRMQGLRTVLARLTLVATVALILLQRKAIPATACVYGVLCVLFLTTPGAVRSIDRYLYGTVTITYALGLLFARYPRLGFVALTGSGAVLVVFAALFSSNHFIN
jgi:hypothetical protein